MRAITTHRDHALSLTVWLVVLTQAVLFGLLAALHGIPTGLHASASSLAIAGALLATCAALAVGHRPLALGLAAATLVCELINVPSDNKLAILLVGLHAAHVAAGLFLIVWLMALRPRYSRQPQHLARILCRYWYFITAAWLLVWPLIA